MLRCLSVNPDERPTSTELLHELACCQRSTSMDGGAARAGRWEAAAGAAVAAAAAGAQAEESSPWGSLMRAVSCCR